jgi:phenylacetate-CoA ligase
MRLRSELSSEEALTRLASYLTLATVVQSGLLVLEVEACSVEHFTRHTHSGKTPIFIDSRR